ncbi:hypothetical protein [Cupriavidus neocaledonicus]|uniref:hypothetical protein n=1 Tax=Cupriavidus neocaledonicus TaxID=1040979 RepID=UPI0011AE5940|nr:hypothetical protein [Cupriavidus neocaledonicus]
MAKRRAAAPPPVDFLQIGRHYTQPPPPVVMILRKNRAENAGIRANPKRKLCRNSDKMRRQSL